MVRCGPKAYAFPSLSGWTPRAWIGSDPACGNAATGGSRDRQGDLWSDEKHSEWSIPVPVHGDGSASEWNGGGADHQPGEPEALGFAGVSGPDRRRAEHGGDNAGECAGAGPRPLDQEEQVLNNPRP